MHPPPARNVTARSSSAVATPAVVATIGPIWNASRPSRASKNPQGTPPPTATVASEGARSMQEPADQFYGDRNARFEDPFGNEWSVMTHIKDVSEKEMKKAMAQMGG